MSILALVYVDCHRCQFRQPLMHTRPRYIELDSCAKWLYEHGWSGNHGTVWMCPECTAKDRVTHAAELKRRAADRKAAKKASGQQCLI